MKFNRFFTVSHTLAMLACTVALSGCDSSSVADTLGMSREAPDEFTVVSRPPLSVPPEFNLRPPRPGEAPLGATANETAQGLLLGKELKKTPSLEAVSPTAPPTAVTPVVVREATSGAAEKFLSRAGAGSADENIRSQLGTDVTTPADTSKAKSLLEKLSGAGKDEPVLDAKKEAERLRANKDTGKPATEGDVQVEKPKLPSLVDKLF